MENGEKYIFKPERPEDLYENRDEYLPQPELERYDEFKHLQGKYIPICYGLMKMYNKVGLVVEDCGPLTFNEPPQDENSKFIIYMRAMWAVERILASGLNHPDLTPRNIVYYPDTLKVRIIDIAPLPYTTRQPPGIWLNFDAELYDEFHYKRDTYNFWWGLSRVFKAFVARPWDLALYLIVPRFCIALIVKKFVTRNVGKFDTKKISRQFS